MLRLREFSAAGKLQGAALHLAFPSALLPAVALDASGQATRVYALTARGFLHCLSLPAAPPAGPPSRGPPAAGQGAPATSRLAGVTADDAMTAVSLSAGARGALKHTAHASMQPLRGTERAFIKQAAGAWSSAGSSACERRQRRPSPAPNPMALVGL